MYCRSVFFFFFQAEDGIRDVAVTGVQTCALPILLSRSQGTRRKPFFRCIKCKGLMPRVPGVGTEPYPEHREGMKRPMLVTRANCIGSVSGRPMPFRNPQL